MKGISWKSRRLSTAEALLAAAASLFAERGYAATTVGLLARRAGVNPALVSYHFGGKEGLHTALLERLAIYLAEPGGPAATARAWETGLAVRLGRRPEAARLLLREALDRGGAGGDCLLERLAGDLARRLPDRPGAGLAEARRRVAALILPRALGQEPPPARHTAPEAT